MEMFGVAKKIKRLIRRVILRKGAVRVVQLPFCAPFLSAITSGCGSDLYIGGKHPFEGYFPVVGGGRTGSLINDRAPFCGYLRTRGFRRLDAVNDLAQFLCALEPGVFVEQVEVRRVFGRVRAVKNDDQRRS